MKYNEYNVLRFETCQMRWWKIPLHLYLQITMKGTREKKYIIEEIKKTYINNRKIYIYNRKIKNII